jgi:predicted component of type VI protein secretion system
MSGFKVPVDFSDGSFYENNLHTGKNDAEILRKSINDSLRLIINTPKGSFKPLPDFGFSLMNHRFENAEWEEKINNEKIGGHSGKPGGFYAKELQKTILQFEPRLQDPEVDIKFDKKTSKISIFISGKLKDMNEDFNKEISFQIW